MELLTNKEFDAKVQKRCAREEAGFTLIEAICAVAILTVGLIGTVAAITAALKYQQISRNVGEAKSIILAQIEEIHSLRDSRRLKFRQISNSPVPTNIVGARVVFTGFPTGFNDVYDLPGSDGVYGTVDDNTGTARPGFKKQIEITYPDINDENLKQITVTVQYPGPEGQVYTLNCVSFLNNDFKQ